MKTAAAVLLATLFASTLSFSTDRGRLVVNNGMPLSSEMQTLHINGKPVQVRMVAIEWHLMGCAITEPCPVGLNFYSYLEPGPEVENCLKWYDKIQAMEATTNPFTTTGYPYLELVFDTYYPWITTDEKIQIIPRADLACYDSTDWTGMVQ